MKTNTLILGAVAGFSAIGTMVAAAAPAATNARAEVIFSQPEKFTDIRDAYTTSEKGRQAVLSQLQDYISTRADKYLPADQKLTLTFTDIDLAGDFEPWRGPEAMDIRVVKDVYPPKMDLEFKLTGPDGTVIKEGKRQLRDLAFMNKLSLNQNESLRFDKALIDDWLKSEFGSGK